MADFKEQRICIKFCFKFKSISSLSTSCTCLWLALKLCLHCFSSSLPENFQPVTILLLRILHLSRRRWSICSLTPYVAVSALHNTYHRPPSTLFAHLHTLLCLIQLSQFSSSSNFKSSHPLTTEIWRHSCSSLVCSPSGAAMLNVSKHYHNSKDSVIDGRFILLRHFFSAASLGKLKFPFFLLSLVCRWTRCGEHSLIELIVIENNIKCGEK
jgi:hypothetical protein